MNDRANEERTLGGKYSWHNQLVVTLFLWFMALSLGPVIILGVFEYRASKEIILNEHNDELSTTNLLFSEQLNDAFDEIITSLFVQSWKAGELVNQLTYTKAAQNGAIKEYIKTAEYKNAVADYANYFNEFVHDHGYADLIIGDHEGNILYAINAKDQLGDNVFTGALAQTRLTYTINKTLSSHSPLYTALEDNLQEGEEPVGYVVMPLHGEDQVAGFLAVEMYASKIQSLFLRQGEILGSTTSSYLVNTEGQIIFGTEHSPDLKLKLPENNPLLTLWLSHIDPKTGLYDEGNEFNDSSARTEHQRKATSSHIRSYQNIRDEHVLGIYYPVNVGGTSLAMISEVKYEQAFRSLNDFRNRLFLMSGIVIIVIIFIGALITRRLVKPINTITSWVKRVSAGDYVQGHALKGNTEIYELSQSFIMMTERLRTISHDNEQRSWMQEGMAGLNDSLRSDVELPDFCRNIVTFLCRYLGFQTGGMYVCDDHNDLRLMGTFAWSKRNHHSDHFKQGEGLVGQVALEQKVLELTDIPKDYMIIASGLGHTEPHSILLIPLTYEGETKGVFEFGLLVSPTKRQNNFIQLCIENIAIAINSAQYQRRVNHLLNTTTKQSETLQEQQEELKSVNEELEKRATILEASEEELKAQSEELQKSNAELEEKSGLLFQQKEQIEQKNRDIEQSKKEIEEKAKQVEQSSKYKSEFLANMSHELRTPLNSLLLLSQMLADNDEGNLTEDQIESAKVIYNGGKELLELINDILDLSKVEAGKMTINLESVEIEELMLGIDKLFRPLAESKELNFDVSVRPEATKVILSDSQRLLQIIKNFLSNAFKFTETGGVYVTASQTTRKEKYGDNTYVIFSVRDTGIGIPEEKQAAIFEAFQQADGSTSRKYGGTGLGLAISKEFASLLGGSIEIESVENEGTTFSILLPDNPVCSLTSEATYADSFQPEKEAVEKSKSNKKQVPSQKQKKELFQEAGPIEAGLLPEAVSDKPALLIVADDESFVVTVNQLAEKHQFRPLNANDSKTALALAQQCKPQAIILTLGLPDMDGEGLLTKLKAQETTKNIPVHIISGSDSEEYKSENIAGYLAKPLSVAELDNVFIDLGNKVARNIQEVLVFDEDTEARKHLCHLIENKGVQCGEAKNAAIAEQMLKEKSWPCLIMDYELTGISCIEFLEKQQKMLCEAMPAVIIHTGGEITETEYQRLQQYTGTIVMKGSAASERIMDEVSLFLSSLKSSVIPPQEQKKEGVKSTKTIFESHKILLVDDDLRNIFALSKALQGLGLDVVIANNGKVALEKLSEEDGIELILMDIMMPVMDGYEAITTLRKNNNYAGIPVIALTAKAMKEDREKCINAGANDYMTKPVDMDHLIDRLTAWLLK